MLIRRAMLLASILSGLFGATQSDAACFGKRNCCQSTPVVCPQGGVVQHSLPHVAVTQAVCGEDSTNVANGGLDALAFGIELGPGETLLSPPRSASIQRSVSSSDLDGRLQAIEDKLDEIKEKTDKLP